MMKIIASQCAERLENKHFRCAAGDTPEVASMQLPIGSTVGEGGPVDHTPLENHLEYSIEKFSQPSRRSLGITTYRRDYVTCAWREIELHLWAYQLLLSVPVAPTVAAARQSDIPKVAS